MSSHSAAGQVSTSYYVIQTPTRLGPILQYFSCLHVLKIVYKLRQSVLLSLCKTPVVVVSIISLSPGWLAGLSPPLYSKLASASRTMTSLPRCYEVSKCWYVAGCEDWGVAHYQCGWWDLNTDNTVTIMDNYWHLNNSDHHTHRPLLGRLLLVPNQEIIQEQYETSNNFLWVLKYLFCF